jgi:3-phosphoshikimate 1-carboxyvinyltransferase
MSDLQASARVFHSGSLRGTVDVPGDKSISHRALILGALTATPMRVTNLNPGRDVRATLEALIALGATVAGDTASLTISGGRLREPVAPLDCMNSGSTARMMLGVCAGANVRARFDGDASLRKRPMEPVAAQLRAFGSKITTTNGLLPMEILGTPEIETRRFILITPSAQIKSALLFAGTFSKTPVSIKGDRGSRDHSERLLKHMGAGIEWNDREIELHAPPVGAADVDVVGDFSSAAFFITAATVTPGSKLTIRSVGVNPTRTGLLDALIQMGADVELQNERLQSGEPVADIVVNHAKLNGISVSPDTALRAIDEIPLLAVAAAFAQGNTKITGVKELRTKESDRVAAIERLLHSVGIDVETLPNGIEINGGAPRGSGAVVETHHDHRTAMAAAVLAAGAGDVAIDSDDSIDVSFPGFVSQLENAQRA